MAEEDRKRLVAEETCSGREKEREGEREKIMVVTSSFGFLHVTI